MTPPLAAATALFGAAISGPFWSALGIAAWEALKPLRKAREGGRKWKGWR